MKTEIYIPLFGVFMGWFLNELSQALRRSRENKPFLSQAISSICWILFILERRRDYLNNVIQANRISDKGLEVLKFLTTTEDDEIETIKQKSKNAISNLEMFEPFMAHEISFFINSAIKSIEENQNDFDRFGPDLQYIKDHVAILNIDIKKFKYFIKSLSLKHSICLYIQFLIEIRKNKQNRESPFREIFENI